jgi:hypothetical protein
MTFLWFLFFLGFNHSFVVLAYIYSMRTHTYGVYDIFLLNSAWGGLLRLEGGFSRDIYWST